jgi:ABC-type polysaccharide/polyol phosphate export permease
MYQKFKRDMAKYWRYAIYSTKAQLKSEVANSYLNWLWWILEPFCFMLIYAFMYGEVFKSKEEYFPVFIFIGLTMWDFFNRNLVQSVTLIKKNKPIVSKVYLPKYVLLISKIGVNGFKMMISFLIVILMLIVCRVPMSINVIYALPILVDLTLISFGVGCFLMHFGVFVEDLAHITNIALRFLFYLTGVFWNVMTRLPEPYNKYICRFNPTAFLLSAMRDSILYAKTPHRKLLLVYFFVGLILSAAGIRTIYKNENSYAKVI